MKYLPASISTSIQLVISLGKGGRLSHYFLARFIVSFRQHKYLLTLSHTKLSTTQISLLHNPAHEILSVHRVSLLDLQRPNLTRVRSTDDHLLHNGSVNLFPNIRVQIQETLTIFIALRTAMGSPFLTSPPSCTRTSTTTPDMGAPS